jgi:hypothetical protein
MPFPSISPGLSRTRAEHAATTELHPAVLRACVLLLLAALSWPLRADVIPTRSVEVRIVDDEVVLNAEFDLSLTETLEEALTRGVPLYFQLDAEIVRPRWYWFDEKVVQSTTQYRVSFQPLTRQYRVASGLLSQTFDTLAEVERLIGRVNARPIARLSELERGARYDVLVRLRLDINQLPKPFQVNALASREWQLASESRRLSLVVP